METIIYYFDRVWIYAMEYPNTIIDALPMDQLAQHCRSVDVSAKYKATEFTKYRSWIDAVAPSSEFLKILFDNEHILKDYKISHLEIAKDQSCNSEILADKETRKLIRTTRKKWSRNRNIFDQHNFDKVFEPDPEKFGTITGKDFSRFFGFRRYARISKVLNTPSIHQEFFIYTPKQVEDRTGVKEIGDLLAFNHKQWFTDYSKRYLLTGEIINKIKLGKWLLNWNSKRKLSKRNYITIELTAQQFLTYKEIYNYPDLVEYIKAQKDYIKSHKQGPKSKWDLQWLKLVNYSRFR